MENDENVRVGSQIVNMPRSTEKREFYIDITVRTWARFARMRGAETARV